jgi:transcriptional regulator with XRE-family HTH domain
MSEVVHVSYYISYKEHLSMSEASAAVLYDAPPTDLPLSVMLFHAAMREEIAISEFAERLGIGALSLRQFISGQTQRPRGRTLELIAEALDIPVDAAREQTALRPTSAPRFADWLDERMHNGRYSRAKLTRETRISDGALRNYLSGQTLPDADQAQRLAHCLKVDSLELAKVLVADQTVRSGGETIPPPEPDTISDETTPPSEELPFSLDEEDEEFAEDQPAVRRFNRINRLTTTEIMVDEEHLLNLWRQLHPQGRRATLIYIAGLLAEG